MDIRYYRMEGITHDKYYFACNKDTVCIITAGGTIKNMNKLFFNLDHFIESPAYEKVAEQDAEPIERCYINATDRPSREGFKHPDVVEPWS